MRKVLSISLILIAVLNTPALGQIDKEDSLRSFLKDNSSLYGFQYSPIHQIRYSNLLKKDQFALSFPSDTVGIYSFRAQYSHCVEHLLIIDHDSFVIIDMRKGLVEIIQAILPFIKNFSFITKDETIDCIDRVVRLYLFNYENIGGATTIPKQ